MYLDRLKSDQKVDKRDLASVLDEIEMVQMNLNWASAKAYKESIVEMAYELFRYTEMLHAADKIFGIAENNSSLPREQIQRHYAEAETRYESALEHLQELLTRNPHLQIALDRAVSFEAGDECSPDAHSVPRYTFSRSHHVQEIEWQTIRSVKIDALEEKLAKVESGITSKTNSPVTTDVTEKAAQLRKLVKRME